MTVLTGASFKLTPYQKSALLSLATDRTIHDRVSRIYCVILDPVGCPRLCPGYCQPSHCYTQECSVLFGTSVANTIGGNRGNTGIHR